MTEVMKSGEPSMLAKRVRKRLDTLGMSAYAASIAAGRSTSFVKNILDGSSRNPFSEHLYDLAIVLSTTTIWLLRGEGPEERWLKERKQHYHSRSGERRV